MTRKKKANPEEEVTLEQNEAQGEDTQAGKAEGVTFTAEEFETLKKCVDQLKAENESNVALLQRTQADFDNYRRRNASVSAESYANGKRECIEKLLPVLDNFDRAMENTGTDLEAWKQGIVLVQRQLLDELSKMGLSEVEAEGKFDPNLHNAVMQESCDGVESGTITAVFMKGYRVGDKIIRHSMVKVAE